MKYLILLLFPSVLLGQKKYACPDSIAYQINAITNTYSPEPMIKYYPFIEENPTIYFECAELLLEDYFQECNYAKVEGMLYVLWKTEEDDFFAAANDLLLRLSIYNKEENWIMGFILTIFYKENYYSSSAVETSFKLLPKGNIFSQSYHPWLRYLLWAGQKEEYQDVLLKLESDLTKSNFYGNRIYKSHEKVLKERVKEIKLQKNKR